jgi:hypothetical protein
MMPKELYDMDKDGERWRQKKDPCYSKRKVLVRGSFLRVQDRPFSAVRGETSRYCGGTHLGGYIIAIASHLTPRNGVLLFSSCPEVPEHAVENCLFRGINDSKNVSPQRAKTPSEANPTSRYLTHPYLRPIAQKVRHR